MGVGVYDYGNPRAWGDNAFLEIPKAGGVNIWKRSVVWYGYFLESPNATNKMVIILCGTS